MNSLPTIAEVAQLELDPLYGVLKLEDYDLWLIKASLIAFRVNPAIVPRVIRAIANIAMGTGFGKIQIFMEDRVISSIKPEESDMVNQPALTIGGEK